VDQLALDVHAIVHPCQQHRLVAERDAGSGEAVAGLLQLQGDLIGVIDMDIEPQRVITLQHFTQRLVHSHGEKDRYPAADADDFDVFDGAQPVQDLLQDARGQHQRIATGQQHVPNFRGSAQVVQLALVVRTGELLVGVAHDA
jgi:hypothetical protein